jgi:hypothetical protein
MEMRNLVMLTMVALCALGAAAQEPPAKCVKGQYLTQDGRCLRDRTGETMTAGDGCNTITCTSPNCRQMTETAMYCGHGDDPAWPLTGGTSTTLNAWPPASGALSTASGANCLAVGGTGWAAYTATACVTGSTDAFVTVPKDLPSWSVPGRWGQCRAAAAAKRNARVIAHIKMCDRLGWPQTNSVCVGTALGLAEGWSAEHSGLLLRGVTCPEGRSCDAATGLPLGAKKRKAAR